MSAARRAVAPAYKLSLRDVAELLLQRGYVVTLKTVRVLGLALRAVGRRAVGRTTSRSCRCLLVSGRDLREGDWPAGATCTARSTATSPGRLDTEQAPRQTRRSSLPSGVLIEVAERKPARVAPGLPMAIHWIAGRTVRHRRERYLNNFTGRSRRAINDEAAYYPMGDFGSFAPASGFCAVFDGLTTS